MSTFIGRIYQVIADLFAMLFGGSIGSGEGAATVPTGGVLKTLTDGITANDFIIFFFGIMILMFVIHLLYSFVSTRKQN